MPDRPLSILFVSSEVYPFAKTGGLADVSHALPIALRELGHDVRVMLPKYGNVSERRNRIHEINRLKEVPIAVGETVELATIKSSSMQNPRTKVQPMSRPTTHTSTLRKVSMLTQSPGSHITTTSASSSSIGLW